MSTTSRSAAFIAALGILGCLCATGLIGQVGTQPSLQLDTGEHIFKSACIACHGPEETGTPQSTAGIERPRPCPVSAQCDQTTPEDNTAWTSVITNGGPSRGFSHIMPSFKE